MNAVWYDETEWYMVYLNAINEILEYYQQKDNYFQTFKWL